MSPRARLFCRVAIPLLLFCLGGCGDLVRPASLKQLAEFNRAGPVLPSVDTDRLVQAKIGGGPYRLVPGDAVELTMPAILRAVTTEEPTSADRITPYVCRVSDSGMITLPRVGEIQGKGRTLAEVESDVIAAYYPKYVVTRPSVFAQVVDYRTSRVSITGAVLKPGVYSLHSDQMSLVALLMEAGGIVDQGASVVRISHQDGGRGGQAETAESAAGVNAKQDRAGSEPLVLPIRGLNVPFADVQLQDGDRVVVERLSEPLVTVIGLVNRPGNFPYPPDIQYNLMQVLAFAGGLNEVADPHYATVYRLKPDGTSTSAILRIVKDSKLTEAARTLIKPGDIVAVEQTPRTRTAMFLDRVFRINLGAYYRLDAWNNGSP
jgi:protein involved in polysaccharide export with SLBB domain